MPLQETRGAASVRGFGFGAGGAPQVDWSKYLIVPYKPGTTQGITSRIGLWNYETQTLDFDFATSYMPSNAKIMRIRDWIYVWFNNNISYVKSYNIFTGAGGAWDLSDGLTQGDIAKIGNNGDPTNPSKVIVAGKAGFNLYIVRYSHNNTTGGFTREVGDYIYSAFTYNDNDGYNYGTPQIAAVGNIVNGVYTYNGQIAYVGIDGYPGPVYTRFLGIAGAGYTTLSPSAYNSILTGQNFSRPASSMLSNNYAYVTTFDNNFGYIFTGSTRTLFNYPIYTGDNMPNGYAPAGIVNNTSNGRCITDALDGSGNVTVYKSSEQSSTYLYAGILAPYTYANSIMQIGVNSTYQSWWMRSYQFSGSNYTQLHYINSAENWATFGGNIASLANRIINGQQNVARVINYGE